MLTRQRLIAIAALLLLALLAVRQQLFVDHFAVNVLYWDSWELYQPLFDHTLFDHTLFNYMGWWSLFDLQHGPHRQGLGGLLIGVCAPLSHWNARWDAYSVSYSLMLAAIAGIWLAMRCGVHGLGLLAVPFIYLNIRQCHMFIATANPAHGALPMLLFTLYCLAWFLKSDTWRLLIISLLTFLLIFTGFGLFVGFLTPLLLVIELIQTLPSKDVSRARRTMVCLSALAANAISWWIFAIGYQIHASGIIFSSGRPMLYLGFIGAMLGNFFGLGGATPLAIGTGLAAFACLLGVCIYHFIRLIRIGLHRSPASVVIFCLSAYALLFSTQAAEGRISIGWQTGASSRYVTLMIPMAMALLIHLATTPSLERYRLSIIFTCMLILGTASLSQQERDGAQRLHDSCLNWETAYLQTGDQAVAERVSHFIIYEGDLSGQLNYLRLKKLNLFDPQQQTAQPQLR